MIEGIGGLLEIWLGGGGGDLGGHTWLLGPCGSQALRELGDLGEGGGLGGPLSGDLTLGMGTVPGKGRWSWG